MDHAKLVYNVSRCGHASGGGQWCSKCNLHTAADQGDVESVTRLLAAGADANYPIQVVVVGWTQGAPLHWAAEFHTGHSTEEKSIAIIQLLIAHGAEVNFQNVNGQTPLHLAVACGHLAVANCLIQNGADVNCQHREGNSPLHTVALSDIAKCLQNRSELARLLLKYGANRDLKNKAGQTAVDIAKNQKRLALLEVFAEKFPPPPKRTPTAHKPARAAETPPAEAVPLPPMNKKVLSFLKGIDKSTTTHEALKQFERDLVPLGPDALSALPHLFQKLSKLTGTGGGIGLKDLCFSGYVKFPGSFGERGHDIAIACMVPEVMRGSMPIASIDVIVRGICGSVKRGTKGPAVLRSLEELKGWLATMTANREHFKPGSEILHQVEGMQRDWNTRLEDAIQEIKPKAAPPVKPAAPPDREVDDLIAKMEARMRESAATERTEIQIPLAEPIVDEAITTTRVQPALGANLPGKLSIVCECGHRGNVKAEYAGRIVACPRCRRKIPVPG